MMIKFTDLCPHSLRLGGDWQRLKMAARKDSFANHIFLFYCVFVAKIVKSATAPELMNIQNESHLLDCSVRLL